MKLMRYNHPGSIAGLLMQNLNDSFFTDRLDMAHSGHVTHANIIEAENGYEIEMSVPGKTREDFMLSLEKNLLIIKMKEQQVQDERRYIRREFFLPTVERSFSISEKIDADNIQAHCTNGILRISLPLKSADLVKRQRREIQID